MNKQIGVTLIIMFLSLSLVQAQTTAIPDANFEQALIDLGIDSNDVPNGSVLNEDINTITDLNVFDKEISDLSGIEGFMSLETLNCSNNSLTTIDLSNNLELIDLNCSSNFLTGLDVSANINLEKLNCQDNNLMSLDVTANTLLKELDVTNNKISTINTVQSDSLVSLKCSNNRLTTIEFFKDSDVDDEVNAVLQDLFCSNNQLNSLDVTRNEYLRNLLCSSNLLTELVLTDNDSLNILDCSSNQLISLVVTNNKFLTNLSCSNNQLSELILSENDSLTILGASNNKLTNLDLMGNIRLESVIVASNQLSALDLTTNVLINSLDVSNNLITTLNLSTINTVVCPEPPEDPDPENPPDPCQSEEATINVSDNQLESLNIGNNYNGLIASFNAKNNPNLYCIQVDDPEATYIDTSWLKDDSAYYSLTCDDIIYTYVPDDNFEAFLEGNSMGDGVDDNNFVLTSEIESIPSLNLQDLEISDLTGIEGFAALQTLDCSNGDGDDDNNNALSSLDLKGNPLLSSLTVNNNDLSEHELYPDINLKIDLSNNLQLTSLIANNSELLSIDLSNNSLLETLDISSNQLMAIDISNLINLDSFNCSSNLLTVLDLNLNAALTSINCASNDLRMFNFRNGNNTGITAFDARINPLLTCINVDDAVYATDNWTNTDAQTTFNEDCNTTYIPDANFELFLEANAMGDGIPDNNLVFTNIIAAVDTLNIINIDIADLSGIKDFIALQVLNCSYNLLSKLDLSNNSALTTLSFNDNPFLYSLNIKNGQNELLENFNATTNPRLTCIEVDDSSVVIANTNGDYDNWFKDDSASYNEDCGLRQTNIPDNNFEQALIDLGYDSGSLDGFVFTSNIEGLSELLINDKKIADLTGITDFVSLTKLECAGSYLTNLDLSNNLGLTILNCGNNRLTDLDVSLNTNLEELFCDSNYLGALDVSGLPDLKILNCSSNNITSTNFLIGNNLEQLYCAKNNLSVIDVSGLNNLKKLDCSDNFLLNLNTFSNSNLEYLNCANNELSKLKISNNTTLEEIYCNSNLITEIETSNDNDNYSFLNILNCRDNLLNFVVLEYFPALKELNCDSNKLNNLDLDRNQHLENVSCASNQLSLLGISNNDALISLNISFNQISSLDLDDKTELISLNISNNDFAGTFDTSPNINLEDLNVSDNMLEELIFYQTSIPDGINTSLDTLNIASNKFSVFEVSKLTKLSSFNCSYNQFDKLDLSLNTELTELFCSSNQIDNEDGTTEPTLKSINLKNGNNTNLKTIVALSNPNLDCIQVDDVDFALNKDPNDWVLDWKMEDDPDLDFSPYSEYCYNYTDIPDEAFEQALIDLSIDTEGSLDHRVLTSDLLLVVDLDISDPTNNDALPNVNSKIEDLSGIEDFLGLVTLDCSSNELQRLDLSGSTELTSVDFNHNNVMADSLNLSKNIVLKTLIANNNALDTINLYDNPDIEILDISYNSFTEFDPSTLESLTSFNCANNEIVDLSMVNNYKLEDINCSNNQLMSLNIQNVEVPGSLVSFIATENQDLICIEVDAEFIDAIPSEWEKDDQAEYSENCYYYQTYIPDQGFEKALIDLNYDSGELDEHVLTANINTVTSLNLIEYNIIDLTGIEAFESLVNFNCIGNDLTSLDLLSSNVLLEILNCSYNEIESLDLSVFPNLTILKVASNVLTTIDLSSNENLIEFDCSSNQLSFLNVSVNSNLEVLEAQSNELTFVDIRNGANPNISYFDTTNNPDLSCILVDDMDANIFDNWFIDPWSALKIVCEDNDNDGVSDEEDLCPGTPVGEPVDLFGCTYFILPADNFTISITSETCISSNNGSINIDANELYNYKATLTGEDYLNTYNFTNGVDILNLLAGTYELCITIVNEPGFEICYDIIITEPDAFSVTSRTSLSNEIVSLELSGSDNYTVDINGFIFNTSDSEITLSLKSGFNTIKIKTDLECQGVYKKSIFLSDGFYLSPNPFEEHINLFVGTNNSGKINVKIYSQLGQLVLSESVIVNENFITIDTRNLVSGIYFLSVNSKTSLTTFKIVKK